MTRTQARFITESNRKWWTLGAMCFALFMIMLDNTVVNVALPSIQRDLGTPISGLEWVINGYTLSFAVLLATGGRLGDIFGRRRMFIIGVIIFTLSSATAGFAPSTLALVLSRVAQGFGAAFMMPGTLSIITDAFPKSERGRAIGTWAGVSALALAIGPVVGGFLVEHVSWRAIFYINLPVGIAAVTAAKFAVRESRDETVGREVDFAGVGILTVGLTALVLALIEGNGWGWGSPAILALFAVAAIGLTTFVMVELRVRAPMIEFSLFASKNFIGAVTIAFIVSFAMLGMFFFLALYMQNILGYTPLEAGVRFLPTTAVIMFVAPIAGRLADRIGPRWPIAVGLTFVTLALADFSTIDRGTTFSDLLPAFVAMGFGIALTMSPMSTAAMNSVNPSKAGVASGVLSMFRMIGGTFGVAATGALFQGKARADLSDALSGSGVPDSVTSEVARGLGTGKVDLAGTGLTHQQALHVADAGRDAFISGLAGSMRLSAGVALAGVVVALTMVNARGARETSAREDAAGFAAPAGG